MNAITRKSEAISSPTYSDLSSNDLTLSLDCLPFLNYVEEELDSVEEWAIVFRSLVATLKIHPVLDEYLETKAVKFLKSVRPKGQTYPGAFLSNFGQSRDDSLRNYVQSIVVLISTPSQVITTATMEILDLLLERCSAEDRLALIKADLLPRLITTLNPQSLSFTDAVDIHAPVLKIITNSVWLANPDGLKHLRFEDENEQQAVHKTVYQQVLAPSEQYIWHLCKPRFSTIGNELYTRFLELLARLLRKCPYYQPTMEMVLHMPVFLTIPRCLSFFEDDHSIFNFLYHMNNAQREWNDQSGKVQKKGMMILRMLRMAGIEDVMEEKLRNDRNGHSGIYIVYYSKEWNNLLGMNLPIQE
ncbi:hypothetical protein BLNAU_9662 [Blattamonas nauphoetae]|uniref:Uncharacterized protein n=1 Tax=Blattamonas nauphoetae TaxID=2049346 RepID=A0ABQ9XVD0_9EUKA|nr:hypothetical protein BLNAU_9662 [Blattamonas nauphoetae]